jgi:ADP-ribose pyrophosphatase
MMARAAVLECRRRQRGRVFDLYTETVRLDNGVVAELDVIRHPGAAAIVAVDAHQRVLMLRQYRHAVGEYLWEIPAGTLEAGESPENCAARELEEESGYRADRWQPLGEIVPVPGYADERIHLFMAAGLTPATQNLDRDEVLSVHPVAFDEALAMIDEGVIQDAKTIASLLMAHRRLSL